MELPVNSKGNGKMKKTRLKIKEVLGCRHSVVLSRAVFLLVLAGTLTSVNVYTQASDTFCDKHCGEKNISYDCKITINKRETLCQNYRIKPKENVQ